MIKFIIFYQFKLLEKSVIYHDIGIGDLKFAHCLQSISHLKY